MSRLPKEALKRLLVSLVADEIGRARGRAVAPAEWTRWGDATRLDEDGVGVDSVDRLAVVGRVSAYFGLPTIGSEDFLVITPTLGGWVGVVAESLEEMQARAIAPRIEFQTSGSTGAPRPVAHDLARLEAEVDAFADVAREVERVWLFTPPHHIYGFIHGVLAPARRELPVFDARAAGPAALGRLRAGDLAVATPHQWSQLLRAVPRLEAGIQGLSSGAPTPPAVFEAAASSRLARLIDIYGSTETAGVGWRDAADAAFTLLPTWSRDARGDGLAPAGAGGDVGGVVDAPDRLAWLSPELFRPAGRRDNAVQVAGVNVSLDLVRRVLLEVDGVADCAVRVDDGDAAGRLKAFVVPSAQAPEVRALDEALRRQAAAKLPAPARPKKLAFGASLPRNAMGKLSDWRAEMAD